ncbi:hypothetical protein F511_06705 [Dorcoceras hygrometricum]|uniref:Uncharacterized protein n=1 Tax=Dorcoceras hygrometricum TaxID=472368 RepID=A0A2Z7B4S3_9LAMI|nr:hypothetical protein F511_06705 [Dorcoceras hygrometricum]
MRLRSVEESEDSATFVVSRDTSLERVLRLEGGLLVSRSRVPLVVPLSYSSLFLSPSDLVFSLPTTDKIWNLMVTVACSWWKWKSSCCACVASGIRCALERMTNRRMEEPVARGMVLRLDKQLRVAILVCGFEEPVEGATRRRMVKLKRCVSSIASGTSFEDSTSFCLAPCDWIACDWIACDWIACDWKVATGKLRLDCCVWLLRLDCFPSFSVEDLSDFGGAGFLVNFSFDCYPFEAAERPWRISRKLLVSGRRAAIPHSHIPAGIVATMRRVVNYHSSWARKQQVEWFDASGNSGSTAGRGFNPAGGAPGGG